MKEFYQLTGNEDKYDERKPLVFKFKLKPNKEQTGYKKIVLFNGGKHMITTLTNKSILKFFIQFIDPLNDFKPHNLWPDAWITADERGGCAYSRIEFKMYCVINDKNSNSVLYSRSLSDMLNDINWTKKEIPGTKGKLFTSLFYWLMTGKIRAQVITRDRPLRTAQIFDYVPTNEALFVKTVKYLI